MKKTKEILGLPIIGILDGMEIGNVKSLIINADARTINYIIVDSGMHLLGAKVIPSDKVLGIGEYAMTVEDEEVISIISKVPAAIELLGKNVSVYGAKILTKKGKMVGEVTEVYFDEEDGCRIKGIEYMPVYDPSVVKLLSDKGVITYGRQLVIIVDEYESMALDVSDAAKMQDVDVDQPDVTGHNQPDYSGVSGRVDTAYGVGAVSGLAGSDSGTSAGMPSQYFHDKATAYEGTVGTSSSIGSAAHDARNATMAPGQRTNMSAFGNQGAIPMTETKAPTLRQEEHRTSDNSQQSAIQPTLTGRLDSASATGIVGVEGRPAADKSANVADDEAVLFEERQKRYLLGRRVTKTILDRRGEVIVEEGSEITDAIIENAKKEGKMVQLVMNNRA